jgi:YaiO family outer membrane protein
MNRFQLLCIVLLIIARILLPSYGHTQEITDPESEYLRIRTMAFDGNWDDAVPAVRNLVKAYPGYGDARILLGRILAWQKHYSEAAAVIDTLLKAEPDNADALAARRDIRLWSRVSTPFSSDIRTGYSFDSFSEPYKRFWQVFNAGFGHRFNWGPALAEINIGNVSIGDPVPLKKTELQMQVEAWPHLTRKNYAYLEYAYSPGSYFPKHRAAFEVWQIISGGWAVSTGLHYYYFDRNIFIADLAVEKYIGKFWLSGKMYVYFKDSGPTTSFYLYARRYFNDIDYLQLTLSTGTAPDEPFDITADLGRLSANGIRLYYNRSFTPKLRIRFGTGYSIEEYAEGAWRNRFEGNINFIYAIKMQ